MVERENETGAKVSVYLDTGQVFEYDLVNPEQGREHASAITKTGYRSVDKDGVMTWFPAHRIDKVKVTNQNTSYSDTVRGT